VPTSPNAAKAQSEAVHQAVMQLNAQIAQMQAQLTRQNTSSRNGEGSQLNFDQINQLKVMQGKLMSQSNMGMAGDWGWRQQHEGSRVPPSPSTHEPHTGLGEMGPPPSPLFSSLQIQQQGDPFHAMPLMMNTTNSSASSSSDPVTPAMVSTASLAALHQPLEGREKLISQQQSQETPVRFRDEVPHNVQKLTASPHNQARSGMIPTDYLASDAEDVQREQQEGRAKAGYQGRFEPLHSTSLQEDRQGFDSSGDIDFETLDWSALGAAL
jgi:hypothetical protein